MTEIVLPGMVDRNRGLLINVSALAAVRPIPKMTLYGASKIFIDYFTQGIAEEYKNDGITAVVRTSLLRLKADLIVYKTFLTF